MISFAETVKLGGFAPAARSLGLSPSAVAKNVARLEADLGLRLLHRTTRQLSLTSEGRDLFERCERIVAELDALRDDAEGLHTEPRGALRLNMPVTYGHKVVVPKLAMLAQRYKELTFELSFADTQIDLVRSGLDAVIRIGALQDSSLVGRVIDRQQLIVVASTKYIARHGTPRTPSDLDTHVCAVYRLPNTGRIRPWIFRDGVRTLELAPVSRFVCDDGEGLVSAALAHFGLVQVPSYMVEKREGARHLREVLVSYRPKPMPISIIFPSRHHVPERLRVVIDALLEAGASD